LGCFTAPRNSAVCIMGMAVVAVSGWKENGSNAKGI